MKQTKPPRPQTPKAGRPPRLPLSSAHAFPHLLCPASTGHLLLVGPSGRRWTHHKGAASSALKDPLLRWGRSPQSHKAHAQRAVWRKEGPCGRALPKGDGLPLARGDQQGVSHSSVNQAKEESRDPNSSSCSNPAETHWVALGGLPPHLPLPGGFKGSPVGQ